MKAPTVAAFMLLAITVVLPMTWAQENGSDGVVYKWIQHPDEDWTGIDIRCDQNDGYPRTLADDFLCNEEGPILDVHFWGSWLWDEKGNVEVIHLSIHSDNPEGPYGWSQPDDLLWEMDFFPGQFDEWLYTIVPDGEWFWDPITGFLMPQADTLIWQYDIEIPIELCFIQAGTPDNPIIYWLDIWVKTDYGEFGWKTSIDHWNDDAVYWLDDFPFWWELIYPPSHPFHPHSIDLAFAITTFKGSLQQDTFFINEMTGGSVNFFLDAGAANAGRSYILLGSASGTTPGTPLPGGTVLPLNWDWYTKLVFQLRNTWFFMNFQGTLDGSGKSVATLNCPPIGPGYAGFRTYYAYTLLFPYDFVSNAGVIEMR